MPKLKICNGIIKRESLVKFLGIILHENTSWKDHIKTIEKKTTKIWVCYVALNYLDETYLKPYISNKLIYEKY